MADFDSLTYYRLVGRYDGIVADSAGGFGDPGTSPDLYTVNMTATIEYNIGRAGTLVARPPELRLTTATPPRTLLLVPVAAAFESGVLRLPGGQPAGYGAIEGVDLVARSAILGMAPTDDLVATVTFGDTTIGGATYRFDPVAYAVPTVAPADYHAGAVQVIHLTGETITGGNWALVYGLQPTVWMPHNADAAAVQVALRNIPAIGAAVTVTGAAPTYTATFDTAAIPRPLPLGQTDNLTGTGLPGVAVVDAYTPPVVDLTTVTRWPAAA